MSCSICKREIDMENAPIIAMGGFGHPRCICDECANKLDVMNTSLDVEEIKATMKDIADTMASNNDDDMVAHNAVKVILMEAGARIEKIKSGDLTEEEAGEELLDVPEDLQETEEDRELDRQDEIKNKKFDSIFNWISLGIVAVAVIGVAIYLIDRFFL